MLTLPRQSRRSAFAVAAGLAVGMVACPAWAQPNPVPMYQITDLGSLAGPTGSAVGLGLNDAGSAVGWSTAPASAAMADSRRPFVFGPVSGTPLPVMRDLLPGVAGHGSATDHNELGMACGTFRRTNVDGPRGFVVGGPLTVVPPVAWIQPLQGGTATAANAINDSHVAVGSSSIAFGPLPPSATHAIKWQAGQTIGLGTLGGRNSEALGINNPGTIVGVSDLPATSATARVTRRAFLVPAGTNQMQGLSALTPTGSSRANDISNYNLTVGASDFGLATSPLATNRPTRAVMWTANTSSIVNLGVLANTDHSSEALAVNSGSDIVGWSGSPFNTIAPSTGPVPASIGTRAFIWRDGVMTDLNTRIPPNSGWTLHVAADTNDSGQIVGWGTRAGNTAAAPARIRAFLLTPMPLDAAEER